MSHQERSGALQPTRASNGRRRLARLRPPARLGLRARRRGARAPHRGLRLRLGLVRAARNPPAAAAAPRCVGLALAPRARRRRRGRRDGVVGGGGREGAAFRSAANVVVVVVVVVERGVRGVREGGGQLLRVERRRLIRRQPRRDAYAPPDLERARGGGIRDTPSHVTTRHRTSPHAIRRHPPPDLEWARGGGRLAPFPLFTDLYCRPLKPGSGRGLSSTGNRTGCRHRSHQQHRAPDHRIRPTPACP